MIVPGHTRPFHKKIKEQINNELMKATWISAVVLGFIVTACYSPKNQSEESELVAKAPLETSFSFEPEITCA